MTTTKRKAIKAKLGLPELAKQLGKASTRSVGWWAIGGTVFIGPTTSMRGNRFGLAEIGAPKPLRQAGLV
jgi:hypothetical protein